LRGIVQVTFGIKYHRPAGYLLEADRVLDKNRADIIGVAIAVPCPVTVPWAVPVIVRAVIIVGIGVIKIIIIEGRPAVRVGHAHSEISVCIIILAPSVIIAVVLLLCYNIFILWTYR